MAFSDVKGLLASKTIWGIIAFTIPYVDQLHAFLLSVPAGVLPKNAQLVVQGLGIILAAYGRYAAAKKIDGVV